MTRVPMGMTATLAMKAGLGTYMSPAMKTRYPGVEFSQFTGAEMIARNYKLEKSDLDAYALQSHQRAIAATKGGLFADEIVPVAVRMADGTEPGEMHTADEGIRYEATLESIASVKLIAEGGRCTAATASQICDGASGVMVVNERGLKALGVKPLARIHHLSVMGHDPVIMLEAPIPATQRALQKAGMKIDDIDLFEVNEAFASVPAAWLQATGADPARLNVNGGAIALGHPIGATGAILLGTLLDELERRDLQTGLVTLCAAGGMAPAAVIERI
jgi:acetyl-CoA C-acetyltransferase